MNSTPENGFKVSAQMTLGAVLDEFRKDGIVHTAVHEAGHALMNEILAPGATGNVVVRKSMSGKTYLHSFPESVMDNLLVFIAGYAAEKLYNPKLEIGLGCSSDFSVVKDDLKKFYQQNKILFTLYRKLSHPEEHFREQFEKDKAFFTELAMDILRENGDALIAIAAELQVKMKISGDEVREIVGRYPIRRDAVKRYRQYVSWYKRKPFYFEEKRELYYATKMSQAA